jgi:hypothetical protein
MKDEKEGRSREGGALREHAAAIGRELAGGEASSESIIATPSCAARQDGTPGQKTDNRKSTIEMTEQNAERARDRGFKGSRGEAGTPKTEKPKQQGGKGSRIQGV